MYEQQDFKPKVGQALELVTAHIYLDRLIFSHKNCSTISMPDVSPDRLANGIRPDGKPTSLLERSSSSSWKHPSASNCSHHVDSCSQEPLWVFMVCKPAGQCLHDFTHVQGNTSPPPFSPPPPLPRRCKQGISFAASAPQPSGPYTDA